MYIRILITFALITFINYTFSQNSQDLASNSPISSSKEAARIIKKGDRYLKYNKYSRALEFYMEAEPLDPANANLLYKIGHCYLFTEAASKSIPYFERAFQLNPITHQDLVLQLGQAYHLTGNFSKAIEIYSKVKQSISNEANPDDYKTVSKLIQECEAGIVLEESPLNIAFDNLGEGVNSDYNDYAFFYFPGDSLAYFTSRRDNTTGKQINPSDGLFYEDVYKVSFDKKNWGKPDNINMSLNTRLNDAITGISNKGKTIYLFSGKNNGDILRSDYVDGEWTKPKPLPNPINTANVENSFTVTEDGKTAYFISSRPENNLGENDIYTTNLSGEDSWSSPKNMGANINTAYDEANVFVSPDGKRLYFSSKGHNTIGGYDIFVSEKDSTGNWQKAMNIGSPINSADNDLYFTIYDSTAFFTSRREAGKGGLDIYGISFLPDEIEKTDSVFTDLVEETDSLLTAENEENSEPGIELPSSLDNAVIVNNINFGMNKYQNSNAYPTLDKLADYLIKNPDAKISITGYSDTQGGSAYNQKLSEKRAQFVSDYLRSKGVKEESFKSGGMGEADQISVNKNKDGSYKRESLGYNRRVEFVVEKQGTPELVVEQIAIPPETRLKEPKDYYSVYVGSSDNEDDFENLKNIPKVKYSERKKHQYVFYIGKYSSITEAQKNRDELIKQGYENAYVFKME